MTFNNKGSVMLQGSCCCGTVKFKLTSPPTMMGTCHCTRCRKSGASTFVFVKRDAFELLSGAESITTYKPEAPYKYNRCFCSKCGSSLGEVTSTNESFPVAANCFDNEIQLKNLFHEFVKEKPSWYEISDDAKQFMEHPHQ
ncbi:GFA family protein [Curvibacter sp. CHRR-16]|uniref:GFA family protein n=1 Tax=Curvibacter sp. CHRR-16 TaxID=2835872 RepID=UPI002023A71C|nr:GFA family protein [Curvibacter sp. CHRR-16]